MNNPVYHLVLKKHKTAKKPDFTNMVVNPEDFEYLEANYIPAWQYSPPTRFEVDVRGLFDEFMKECSYSMKGKDAIYTIELLIDSYDSNGVNTPKIICSRNFYGSQYNATAKHLFSGLFISLLDNIQDMIKQKDINILWKEYDKYQKQFANVDIFLDEEDEI